MDGELSITRLSRTAQAGYEALVDRTATSVADLCAVLGQSEHKVSRAVSALVARGLVSGTADRLVVTPPGVALNVLLLEAETELERARLHALRLAERHRQTADNRLPTELVEVVHGSAEITRRAEQIMRTARHEVCFIDKPPYAKLANTLSPIEADLLLKGVRFRGLYDRDALELHNLLADLEAGIALGEEARVLADAPTKMILVDDRLAIIPLSSAPPALDSAVIVHPSALLLALGALFHALWHSAMPLALRDRSVVGAEGLSETDLRLLALLTAGMPDRSIARQLGLSYRTFQRRLHDLMARMGAHTRFQAGLQAAARGWVPLQRTHPLSGPT
nr:helix-turn-helix transcriptional regulator [Kibdelosporangium sp. MJ126-NF4]CEL13704.1 putative regulatory protein [Kibdelosporangium sp. MJ126-NF4]CTQ99390.1 putative regulatory protein [Kibdelosporangium sp. MJ126-NF4]